MQVHRAVSDAEATCGFEFCVVFCSGDGPVAEQGRAALEALGLHEAPPVLVVVRESDGAVDVALGSTADGRLTRRDVDEVVALCPPGDFGSPRQRVAALVLTLADRAGPGAPDPTAPRLPDVITA